MRFGKFLPLLVLGSLLAGCLETAPQGPQYQTITLVPTIERYEFIQQDPMLKEHFPKLYAQFPPADPTYLSAVILAPAGYQIKFNKTDARYNIDEYTTFKMREGVYPFELWQDAAKEPGFVGAIATFNVDKTVELATFGLTDETKLFNPEMLQKANEGVLANYTISFDDKKVLHYWLGNRETLFPGGNYQVELDFSRTPNLTELKINNVPVTDGKMILAVGSKYRCQQCGLEKADFASFQKSACPKDPRYGSYAHLVSPVWANIDYKLEMTKADGRRFQGYVRNLKGNAFTSFLTIPCEIPDNLFDLAAKGTIAKLTVHAAGEESVEIAEVVFGRAK